MYSRFEIFLVVTATTFLLANGTWLSDFHRFERAKRNYPSAITLNDEVKECGVPQPDHGKCSCQVLLCNGKQSCQHTSAHVGFKFAVSCELQKPWREINLDGATAGDKDADCACGGQMIKG